MSGKRSHSAYAQRQNSRARQRVDASQKELFDQAELRQAERMIHHVKNQSRKAPGHSQNTRTKGRKAARKTEMRSLMRFFMAFALIALALSSVVLLLVRTGQEQKMGAVIPQTLYPEPPLQKALSLQEYLKDPVEGYRLFTIRAGSSASEIAMMLYSEGLLAQGLEAEELIDLLIDSGIDRHLVSGDYLLPQGVTLEQAALALSRGYGSIALLNIYPGMTMSQIDAMLVSRALAEPGDFTEAAAEQTDARGLPFTEGYLLAGTYLVPVSPASARHLAQAMTDSMQSFLSSRELPLPADQLVRIASMIQKETSDPSQMGLIASIIANRLEARMPLGIDATTRYETDNWDGPITKSDLRSDSPYNTRISPGLPPSGICSPGLEALSAVLSQTRSPYYYYLHDAKGQIHPAETYQEHLENVQRYL